MSSQRATLAQREKIVKVLRQIQGEEYAPGKVAKEFGDWCRKRNREPEPSDETVRKWCMLGFPDKCKLPNDPKIAGFLYAFALHKEKELDPDDFENMLLRSVGQLFASTDPYVPVGPLKRLQGTYAIIRRRWRLPDNDQQFIKCIVGFEATSDRVIYNEIEVLGEIANPDKDTIDERYSGYTFLFGSNIWIIARETHRASLKFLTIHHCEPPIMYGKSPINSCRGNLIAVCGFGPNESHRFVLQRTNAGMHKCSYIHQNEVKKLLDRDDFNFLCSDNG